MHRHTRLLLALAAWLPAVAAYAHPGDHVHAHPHLDGYLIVLALAVVAGIAAWRVVRQSRRNKRQPTE